MTNDDVWEADIGSWERGRRIDLPGVKNRMEALEAAGRIVYVKGGEVVQVLKNGRCVWDYMNFDRCYPDC